MKSFNFVTEVIFLCFFLTTKFIANAENHYYDWSVNLSLRAPLGITKEVIVINGQFPGPVLNVTTNDVVTINIHNNLDDPFLMTWNGVQLRRNSWQDGVQGTNCPIKPGKNWTYSFQFKDQIGSFFYFPTLLLHKAAGGYGAIHVNNRYVIPLPFPRPFQDIDVLIGDWFNADYRYLRASIDEGKTLPLPDGILINGLGPNQSVFHFQPGATYRLRITNVGLKTSLNFRIEDHLLQLVETEGSYLTKQYQTSLDIHVGQSYSVLVTAKNHTNNGRSYYMVASSRFTDSELFGIGIIWYPDSFAYPSGPLPQGPSLMDYGFSLNQARSMRWDLGVGAARPNPQGSYHYGSINVSRTLVLENADMFDGRKIVYTINGVSNVHPNTPLKLLDYFQINDVVKPILISERPFPGLLVQGVSVIYANYRDFYHIVFQNRFAEVQTWHIDGYNVFVVGMDYGTWDESKKETYNLIDAVSRSSFQVYPASWTAVMVKLDNQGMWNLRSQDAVRTYLGQELYIRVKGIGHEDPSTISPRDELPIPHNAILCGKVAHL
ncbi:L-ascorbate oxidase homolog [Jatropha curcas]|uniref:L-ascorbate oxidase homolog n=1 Tax=Jatropha curcas TaxID=180498 RepID=UPI0009D65F71|nr:L-ascorbate oxidase homolog [Jatropha curcas]